MSKRRRGYGQGTVYLRDKTWWIQYYHNGQCFNESSRSRQERDAWKLLQARQAAIAYGQPVSANAKKVKFSDLREWLQQDYLARGRRSWPRADRSFRQLKLAFGDDKAIDITPDRLYRYLDERRNSGASNATIQNELAALKRAFTLAKRRGMLAEGPTFPTITVDNARDEFIEDWEYAALYAELPASLKRVLTFAFYTGWRTASEILPLQWHSVDFTTGTVRLAVGTTKNRAGRTFPFSELPPLREALIAQRDLTEAVQLRTGKLVPSVFHREGRPVKDMYAAWRAACRRAGVFGKDGRPKILHDCRRSAVRRMERAGVPRSVAMELIGHKTASMYQRYSVFAERDLAEGIAKVAKLLDVPDAASV